MFRITILSSTLSVGGKLNVQGNSISDGLNVLGVTNFSSKLNGWRYKFKKRTDLVEGGSWKFNS